MRDRMLLRMMDAGPPPARTTRHGRFLGRRTGVIVGVVAVAPLVALVVWALTTTLWSPGDVALTEIAVRDVGGVHTPLVGVYSRYGWHHPGPLLFYVLAGPYRLLGADGSALAAAAAVLNGLAVAGSAVLLWRRGRLGGLLIGALIVGILTRSLGGEVLASAWNPVVTVFPMLLFVLAVWSVTCGDRWQLLTVVAVGSFLAQSHVGTGLVVAVGVVAAAGVLVVPRRSRPVPSRLWIGAAVIGAVLWLPPVVEAIRHRGGNVRALLDFWVGSHEHVTGWARSARIVGAELTFNAPWITGDFPRRGFLPGVDPDWTIPLVGILFLVALVMAVRRRPETDAGRLGLIAAGFTVVAWVSVARIVDEPFDYLLRWTGLVGGLAFLAIGWLVLESSADGARPRLRWRRAGALVLGAAVLTFSVVNSVEAFSTDTATLGEHRVFQHLAPELVRAAPSLRAPVLIDGLHDIGSAGLAADVLTALRDTGVDARFPRSLAWQVGATHVVDPRRAGDRLLVGFGDGIVPLLADARYSVVAFFDELTPAERRELEADQPDSTDLAAATRWARLHPQRARRAAQLGRRSARGVVLLRHD